MMRRIKFESVRGVLRRGVVRKGNLWVIGGLVYINAVLKVICMKW